MALHEAKRRLFFYSLLGATLWALNVAASAGSADELRGNLVVVGRGPERPVIEKLGQAFERTYVGTMVEIRWNQNFRISEMIKSRAADLAVAGREEAGLEATTIAWDGLAVIVNFSNPIKDVSIQEVAALFSGEIRDWSELNEKANGKVRVVSRPDDQNLSDGFERSLGIRGRIAQGAERLRSDQMVLSRVAGQLETVAFVSLRPALEAMKYGLSVRTFLIDGVEAGKPTVRSGAYKLRRPVILLTQENPTPLARAFLDFCRSHEGQLLVDDWYVPLTP